MEGGEGGEREKQRTSDTGLTLWTSVAVGDGACFSAHEMSSDVNVMSLIADLFLEQEIFIITVRATGTAGCHGESSRV